MTATGADPTKLSGPFDVIGDVHGCLNELEALLVRLGYEPVRDADGRPVSAHHPSGRRVVFVGDMVDRGPDSAGVLRLAIGMVDAGAALALRGNHEHKLIRALQGRNVLAKHGLSETLAQLESESARFRERVLTFCEALVPYLILDGGNLVVAHAGLNEKHQARPSAAADRFAMYGDVDGTVDEYGLPVRRSWESNYNGSATVVFGHTPTTQARWVNNTICIDTGCVFGGHLTAMRYPEREVVSVPASRVWCEPTKPI